MKYGIFIIWATFTAGTLATLQTRQAAESCRIAEPERRGCGTHETGEAECEARGCCWNECSHCDRTVPRCYLSYSEIRLVGGPEGEVAGRLEILHEGVWGTVCDDNFGLSEARVVCAQLGSIGGQVREGAFFGQGSTQIWLDEVSCYGNEEDFHHCQHNGWGNHDCTHWEDVGVICGDEPETVTGENPLVTGEGLIRLVNGTLGAFSGRLEVYHNGTWGTICDDDFGEAEAEVVCQELGSYGGEVRGSAFFGEGTGPILMDGLSCYGTEWYLSHCHFNGWGVHDCAHYEDVGVVCGTDTNTNDVGYEGQIRLAGGTSEREGRLEVYHDYRWGTVCDDGFSQVEAERVCLDLGFAGGYQTWIGPGTGPIHLDNVDCSGEEVESFLQCAHNEWGLHDCTHQEDVSILCEEADMNPVRLMDGTSHYEGRVEIFYRGHWGTVCDDWFDDHAADVVCRQLGFGAGHAQGMALFGPGGGPILLDDVMCHGAEETLAECVHNGWGLSDCTHAEDASVICEVTDSDVGNTIPVRLVGGVDEGSGRVEVFYNDAWGTICDDAWDNMDAQVVCRQLGLDGGDAYSQARYGPGEGPVHLDSVSCAGDEASLSLCPHDPWGMHDCTHDEDASVVCVLPWVNPIRIVNGSSPDEGRLEVFHGGRWGTVCDDYWDSITASVACKQLGYSGGDAMPEAHYGAGTGPILLDNVMCYGYENNLMACYHDEWGVHDCTHGEDVGISCYYGTKNTSDSIDYDYWVTTEETYTVGSRETEGPPMENSLRLVGSEVTSEGRVEIYHEGEWGTVCDDFFDDQDAVVVCRQLGYQGGRAIGGSYFGEGWGAVHLDSMACGGWEERLEDCRHDPWGEHDCSHMEDAGVVCDGPIDVIMAHNYTSPNQVRLTDGLSVYEGRVEVFHEGEWGTVCDDYFGDPEARVVCRQLGFEGGVAYSESHFGPGEGRIWMDTLRCHGDEDDLAACVFDGWGEQDCSHLEDASVVCEIPSEYSGPPPPIQVRLAGGEVPSEGRVEVMYAGEWGTVCDDWWDDTDASVVCRQLGYDFGRSQHQAYFGAGSQDSPIWLDTVECFGDEVSLSGCSHEPWGQHDCQHVEDAGVECDFLSLEETPNGMIRLLDGEGAHEGRVEIFLDGQWGTICDDYWDRADAAIVCRSLGYASGISRGEAYFGEGTGPVLMANLGCFGDEANLLECTYETERIDCGHNEDAGVTCDLDAPYIPDQNNQIRLAGGPTPLAGRVEVFHNGVWGTICDDGWDDMNAHVVCRQLGLQGGRAFGESYFGDGHGPVWLDEVLCWGQEEVITECDHVPWGLSDCGHFEDASVVCEPRPGSTVNNNTVRLVGGMSTSEGRVEVYHEGVWGTICDDMWNDYDATVVCRQMGYETGIAYHEAFFGPGEDPIWLSRVQCSGEEGDIKDCDHGDWGRHSCFHSEDAAVRCDYTFGPTYIRNYELRLSDGLSASEGRLEIYHGGEWGTVCDDHWDDADATVVCREMGYNSGRVSEEGYFGPGVGPIQLDSVDCGGMEAVLNECNRINWGDHDCTHAEDAGVICAL